MKLFEPGSLWSYKGYRLFWLSNTIFVFGASAFPIALAVTVLDAGGTATTLGLILGARVLSGVVFAPFAGVWATVVLDQSPVAGQGFIAMADVATPDGVVRLAAPKSDVEFARVLYAALRAADEQGLSSVVVAQPQGEGIAIAIRDRLKRAAHSES